MIEIHPLPAIGEVQPGDDLAQILAGAVRAAGIEPVASDVLVVTQKIVSKAEGRFVALASVTPGDEALELAEVTRKDPRLVELVLAESQNVVRAVPHVLITRHRSGHVMANAGIDRSNIGPGEGERALLLPVDADASAERLRAALAKIWAEPPAILISDSFGRPWRHGVTCVAIGASGLPSLIDRRGDVDRDGRVLEVTQIALGDMIATAAGLATGEGAEGVPAALVRGFGWTAQARPAAALVRPPEEDLFR
jgi:coenzyme F420-0:L-glutamate ligase/coenzyme F420-1:gamma-L-glutamate ligase